MSIDLRLDQDQIDEYDYEIMLDVFVAELPAVLAYCQSNTLTAGRFIGALIFGVEGFDGEATFYADWHLIDALMRGRHWTCNRYDDIGRSSVLLACACDMNFGKRRRTRLLGTS